MRAARTLLITSAIAALLATGCEWHFEALDGNGGPNGRTTHVVGEFSSTVVYNTRPHVFYYDSTDYTLRHAYYNGQFWAFETLDGNGGPNGRISADVGQYTSVILYNGRPHVFYFDNTNGNLRHGYYNGSTWVFETLDGNGGPNGRTDSKVGLWTSVVLYDGRPHVFYNDNDLARLDLRHGYWNGQSWVFETLDGHQNGPHGQQIGNAGFDNAALLYNGRPHVFSYSGTGSNLRHGYWNGQFWVFETLDGAGGANGRISAALGRDNAAVLSGGRPHVFYYDITNKNLRHAYYTGTAWGFETLDGAGGQGGRLNADLGEDDAASVSGGNRPHIYYFDDTHKDLRHASWNGATWAFETLDGGGGGGSINADVGNSNSALLYNGRQDVFYWDNTNGDLRHAYFG